MKAYDDVLFDVNKLSITGGNNKQWISTNNSSDKSLN